MRRNDVGERKAEGRVVRGEGERRGGTEDYGR